MLLSHLPNNHTPGWPLHLLVPLCGMLFSNIVTCFSSFSSCMTMLYLSWECKDSSYKNSEICHWQIKVKKLNNWLNKCKFFYKIQKSWFKTGLLEKKNYSAILVECNFLNLIKIINQKLEAINNSLDTPILKLDKRQERLLFWFPFNVYYIHPRWRNKSRKEIKSKKIEKRDKNIIAYIKKFKVTYK